MDIGEKIKALRTKLDLTQEELAGAAGTTKQTIHKYETGIISNIPASKVKAMADKLDTTPAYLMGWEDDITEKGQPINELPLLDSQKRVLASVTDLPDEDIEKVIDYAELLKKARNP